MNCLLIDDDSDDRSIFAHVLTKINPSVSLETAFDGVDAIEKLKSGLVKPDLIFLDLNMPKMDGKQCLAEIKADLELRCIPVVIYSTSNSSGDIQQTQDLGACDYLIKPFDVAELQENISRALTKLEYYRDVTLKKCSSM